MYRTSVYESTKLIDSIYIVGIQNYDVECKIKLLLFLI